MPKKSQTMELPLEEMATEIHAEAMPDADFAEAAVAAKPSRRGARSGGGSGGRAPARPATPKELASVLAKIIGAGSDVGAWVVGVDELSMSPAEAGAIAEPAARILARSGLGKALTKRLATSSDAIDLVLALLIYGSRVAPAVRAKMERDTHGNPRATPATPVANPGAPADAAEGIQLPIAQYHPLAAGAPVALG